MYAAMISQVLLKGALLCALCGVIASVQPPATPSAGGILADSPIRVACIGDSITAGACSNVTHGYPAVLQTLLGSGYAVKNFGVGGRTMLRKGLCGPNKDNSCSDDCSYWSEDAFQKAMDFQPHIVTIMFGTNDAKVCNWDGVQTSQNDSFVKDYLDFVATIHKLESSPRIYLMIPPPLYPPFPYSMNKTVINAVFPTLIKNIAMNSLAQSEPIDVFDALGGASLSMPNITCDGCHPRDPGYEIIAKTIADTILA